MAENEFSKAELWIKRIQDFYSSLLKWIITERVVPGASNLTVNL